MSEKTAKKTKDRNVPEEEPLEAEETEPAAAEDETFGGGSDQVTYQIDVKAQEGPFTVHAELLYQTLSYRFAHDLCQEEAAQAEIVCSYYDAADHSPAVIASAQKKVR